MSNLKAITLGRNVRAARGRLGLFIHELAQRSHLSIDTIGRIERGEGTNEPQAPTLARLAEALETTVDALEGFSAARPSGQPNGQSPQPLIRSHSDNPPAQQDSDRDVNDPAARAEPTSG